MSIFTILFTAALVNNLYPRKWKPLPVWAVQLYS